MKRKRKTIPRRSFIAGMASTAGAALTGCAETDPPTYGNILRMGDNLTYKAHRFLIPDTALVKEYDQADISPMPAIGTTNPADSSLPMYNPEHGPAFERTLKTGFEDWRLTVEGSVARPGAYSLADLKRMPSRTQVTRHTCEEGWSAIAQWTGVPLRTGLEACGIQPQARFVQFYTYDYFVDGIDMVDAMHPQTILAYGMNGRELPLGHGAPLRLRVERQVGYKSLKFLRKIVVTDEFDDHGELGSIQAGWAWYVGI